MILNKFPRTLRAYIIAFRKLNPLMILTYLLLYLPHEIQTVHQIQTTHPRHFLYTISNCNLKYFVDLVTHSTAITIGVGYGSEVYSSTESLCWLIAIAIYVSSSNG